MDFGETSDLWWKTAVVYCLDVQTFMDWDDDGVGDFQGLTERIDYLAGLGVTCLWLMPFHPTTGRDDGYDITDYYGVDPRLGHHGDFVELVRTARDRGMRVIIDLVVNHTSDQHPWFLDARSSKESPYRDFYVWRSDPPPDTSDQVVFPDAEDSVWELDEHTGEYYLHSFYRQQPDLDIANPRVRDEIAKVLGFWLELGVSGFRVDAVPSLLDGSAAEPAEPADGGRRDPHDYLRDLRAFIGRRRGDAMLLGEVNLPYDDQVSFFGEGDGDQLNMIFDFTAMQRMYLSLAREDARPLADALDRRPRLPVHSQWGVFARNHDELTLDRLSDDERAEVFAAFGPEDELQLFGRGLRRRVPPMVDGDDRRVRLVYSLTFSLPGTPVLFYGEEIGMGENLELDGRMAVRSPMQWADGPNGGFSRASPDRLPRRPTAGRFGPEHVNVAGQRQDPDSLLAFFQTLVRVYRESPELGWAELHLHDQPHKEVLAHECRWGDRRLLLLHNLGPEPREVRLTVDDSDELELLHVLGSGPAGLESGGRLTACLEGYGYRWLRLATRDGRRLW
ncbi:alpha-amylase family protein [Nocardioides caldifontis]|uniref:alpha-amylase family protein n=1 Tax=Nocardioides caldifontis TaxID=2588938 RepID=UPI0011E028D2|nr:alpha-amylase family protein [Nocardioides caldifontis]